MTALPRQGDHHIAAEIGATLRSARAARGISLAEMHARTKISTGHLVALEEGRLDALPPLAFTRGFLRTVAGELGVDPEPLVRGLNAAMAACGAERPEVWPRAGTAIVAVAATPPLRRRAIYVVMGALVAVLAVVVLMTLQLREFARPVPPAPPPEGVATPSAPAPAPSPVSSPEAGQREAQPPSGAVPAHPAVTVEVRATGRSWLLVQTGAETLFEGFINAGGVMRWQSRTPISLRAGNAGAVVLVVNGSALGTYGRTGEVVDRTFQPGAPP